MDSTAAKSTGGLGQTAAQRGEALLQGNQGRLRLRVVSGLDEGQRPGPFLQQRSDQLLQMGLQCFESSKSGAEIVLHQGCQHPALATGGQGAPKGVPGAVDQDFQGGVRSQRKFRHVVNATAAWIPVKFLGIPVTLEWRRRPGSPVAGPALFAAILAATPAPRSGARAALSVPRRLRAARGASATGLQRPVAGELAAALGLGLGDVSGAGATGSGVAGEAFAGGGAEGSGVAGAALGGGGAAESGLAGTELPGIGVPVRGVAGDAFTGAGVWMRSVAGPAFAGGGAAGSGVAAAALAGGGDRPVLTLRGGASAVAGAESP
jgi:hypothetical protein